MKVIAIGKDAETVQIPLSIQGAEDLKVTIDVTTDLSAKIGEMDYISLHVPKQDDGSAVLDKAMFAKMKDGVRIVNAARGGVINEDDLLEAISNGKVAAIGLDVYENEPSPRKDLLNKRPNCKYTSYWCSNC